MGTDLTMQPELAYLPGDRRLSIATHTPLPQRAKGTVLFADISGFTPLTEALVAVFGPRRGAEEATRRLNHIYDQLIASIHAHRGHVINFSGDGLICWFACTETDPTLCARHGVAAAWDIQRKMEQFATLSLDDGRQIPLAIKTALAGGPVRRFAVGDAAIQLIDVIAGDTVDRAAAGERLAAHGDTVIDATTLALIAPHVRVLAWRTAPASGARFAVIAPRGRHIDEFTGEQIDPSGAPAENGVPLFDMAHVAPWLLPAVRTRLHTTEDRFLAELRPAVALFARFGGLDFDADPDAATKLDQYICWVQQVLERFDGALIQLTTGDKGSYLYAAFGAPTAHDDDPSRAAQAAHALLAPPARLDYRPQPQIGICHGRMRAGAYGSRDRRTYGVQGPAVNLAARLMMQAKPGQVLTDPHSATLLEDIFVLNPAGHVVPKGQSQSVPVLAVGRRLRHSPIQHEHGTTAPVVGRDDELAVLTAALARACSGQGQVVRLEAETGMGRSSLVAAFVQSAKRAGAIVAAAGCESTEGDTAYFAARQIAGWLLGLGLLRNATPAEKVDHIRHFVQSTEPDWLPRLPLLGDLLGLPIPDNDLTAGLDARLRREALYSLTVAIVQTITKQTPLVLVVEDIHWIDEASLGLLMALGRSVAATRLLLLLTHRSQAQEQDLRRLNTLEQVQHLTPQTTVTLGPLAQAAIRRLIENRLGGPTTSLLLELIQSQAQGNPFFAEELLDALRERAQLALDANGHWHLQPATLAALRQDGLIQERDGVLGLTPGSTFNDSVLGLPASLHGAVLERLDALPEPLKLTLKTASVIGRRFSLQLLAGVHPTHVTMDALEAELAVLTEHHFTRVDVEGTSGSFLFRHNITQEVVYRTLLDDQRRLLHQAAGESLEVHDPTAVEQLAHHFYNGATDQMPARTKALHYLDGAAQRAQREYANETALLHLDRAMSLDGAWERLQRKTEILHLLGRRDEEAAALRVLGRVPGVPEFDTAFAWGTYHAALSHYAEAGASLDIALNAARAQADPQREARVLTRLGLIAWRQGEYGLATEHYVAALTALGNDPQLADEEADVRYGLGLVHRQQGQYDASLVELTRALTIYQRIGHRPNEAKTLIAIGHVEHYRHNFVAAMTAYEAALPIYQATGDRAGIGLSMLSLAQGLSATGAQGDAYPLLHAALAIYQEIGDTWSEILVWNELGVVAMLVGDFAAAQHNLDRGVALSLSIGDESGVAYTRCNLGQVLRDSGQMELALVSLEASLAVAEKQHDRHLEASTLQEMAITNLAQQRLQTAIAQAQRSSNLFAELELRDSCLPNELTIATAWLELGEVDKSWSVLNRAAHYLLAGETYEASHPQRDYWTAGTLLLKHGHVDVAQAMFGRAHLHMTRQLQRISDPHMRHTFLNNLPFNREIAAWIGEPVGG